MLSCSLNLQWWLSLMSRNVADTYSINVQLNVNRRQGNASSTQECENTKLFFSSFYHFSRDLFVLHLAQCFLLALPSVEERKGMGLANATLCKTAQVTDNKLEGEEEATRTTHSIFTHCFSSLTQKFCLITYHAVLLITITYTPSFPLLSADTLYVVSNTTFSYQVTNHNLYMLPNQNWI